MGDLKLTEAESEAYDRALYLLTEAHRDHGIRPCLIRSALDGTSVACMAVAWPADEDGRTMLEPLAILVSEEIMARLTDPQEMTDG